MRRKPSISSELLPGTLDALRAPLDDDPRLGFAYGRMRFFGDWEGELRFPPYDPYRLLYRHTIGLSALARREVFEQTGGYDTDFAHLARGFAGNDRALAMEVGESLLAAGLLLEKPSVGQRHVYLNPRRAKDIYALIDSGRVPQGMALPKPDR